MPNQNVENLAEKIAGLLQNESRNTDLSTLNRSIEKINQRLDGIEDKLTSQKPQFTSQKIKSRHPSQETYKVIEAIVDEVFEDSEDVKTCTFEPNEKPCDHCSMCSSHGF